MRLSKDIKSLLLLLIALTIIGGGGYYFYSIAARNFIPPQFTDARSRGSEIAKLIVSAIEESLKNLQLISEEDRGYHFQKALALVKLELERAKESRKKASELTRELDTMIRSSAQVMPARTRNLAIEAVTHELSLISHLIVYNDTLNGLLQTLEFKFSGDIRYDVEDVQNLIKGMNFEAEEINRLNKLFNEKMKEFDSTMSL